MSEHVISANFITQIAKIDDCRPCSRPDFSAAIWSLYLEMVPLERMTTGVSKDIIFEEIISLGTKNQVPQNSKIHDFCIRIRTVRLSPRNTSFATLFLWFTTHLQVELHTTCILKSLHNSISQLLKFSDSTYF